MPLGRPLGMVLAGLTLLVPAACAGGTSGTQPASITTANPPDQASLPHAPEAVELAFSAEVRLADSHVAVADDAGTVHNAGPLRPGPDHQLRQPVRLGDVTGDLTVAYHVEFTDGGEARGVLRFSVGTGRPPASAQPDVDALLAEAGHVHNIDPLSGILLAANALLVAGICALLMLRRPERPGVARYVTPWQTERRRNERRRLDEILGRQDQDPHRTD
ncbi:copper resistance protein CopC [Solwaraspora sp. WMMD406]|uniref:copper resistance CopC family protein n=1 Tax=Solwaraspora sp. WMMD406 TaxID=3016095 RepID=UPI0024173805|nr:copper resistance CopC family protein [Solwaraspora sp. WMMD406]MDG4766094.1 copper resistance protein CopC [Solwaraspora sp. WMMD406]